MAANAHRATLGMWPAMLTAIAPSTALMSAIWSAISKAARRRYRARAVRQARARPINRVVEADTKCNSKLTEPFRVVETGAPIKTRY